MICPSVDSREHATPVPGVLALQRLTDQGLQKINDVARRYGVSTDAVMSLLQSSDQRQRDDGAVQPQGIGRRGPVDAGGMTMVSDLFNHALKAKVDGLCNELSQLLSQQPFAPPAPGNQSQWQGGQQQYQSGQERSATSVAGGQPVRPGDVGQFRQLVAGRSRPAERQRRPE